MIQRIKYLGLWMLLMSTLTSLAIQAFGVAMLIPFCFIKEVRFSVAFTAKLLAERYMDVIKLRPFKEELDKHYGNFKP